MQPGLRKQTNKKRLLAKVSQIIADMSSLRHIISNIELVHTLLQVLIEAVRQRYYQSESCKGRGCQIGRFAGIQGGQRTRKDPV